MTDGCDPIALKQEDCCELEASQGCIIYHELMCKILSEKQQNGR